MDPVFDSASDAINDLRTTAPGPSGALPLETNQLRPMSGGDLFGWTPPSVITPATGKTER